MTDMDAEERKRREKIVIEEFDGICPMYEAFYLESIAYAAGCAAEAFDRYDEALESEDKAAIVANVQEALAHAAAVSRYFWPPRARGPITERRALKLLGTFALDENSPLCNRDLRNALEHFEERLDEYLLKDLAGYFFPGPMVGSSDMADEEIGHLFRLVDPEKEIFVLFGTKYAFGALREAVAAIYHASREAANYGGRLPDAS